MKRLLPILSLLLLSFTACNKESGLSKNETGGPEPIPPKIISRDTLTTGQVWGITIGQTSAGVYAQVQAAHAQRAIGYLGVTNNVYTDLASLNGKIPLYKQIFFDEMNGTGTGIQVSFANDKVDKIFTNDGVQLSHWPIADAASASVAVGNPIDAVYQKLVTIKAEGTYANKLERISIFNKDVNKAYDPLMDASPLWYVSAFITEKRYQQLDLNFTDSKLVSIYSTVYESGY